MNRTREDHDDWDALRVTDMHAAEFVERRDGANWAKADEAALEQWLLSPANRVAFLRLNASWKRTERLIALRTPNSDGMPRSGQKARTIRTHLLTIFVLMLALGSMVAAYLMVPRYEIYATSLGGHRIVRLADGSQIELNTDTLLRISENTGRRFVRLDRGEAYFQIHHNASHPFVIAVAGRLLTDLGTKFSVRTEADQLKVVLVDGRVRVDAKDSSGHAKRAILSAGDVLVASPDTLSIARTSQTNIAGTLAWRRGKLVFHNSSLADAASEFNRYNETKIVIPDPAIAREPINGTLPSDGLSEFVRMARNIFGLHSEKRGNVLVITR